MSPFLVLMELLPEILVQNLLMFGSKVSFNGPCVGDLVLSFGEVWILKGGA